MPKLPIDPQSSTRSTKNIVVCCDGTSNEFVKDLTNVAKLTYALVKDPERQLVYYHPGLGTMAAPGFPLPIGNRAARLAGLAFGYGIKDDVRDAYQFIMNRWRPGDKLFLFGFSRGAYTARALASMIRMYGVAMPDNDPLVPYAVRMMWGLRGGHAENAHQSFAEADRFKASLSVRCRPHFVGVWDTVSSVGWVGSPLSLPYTHQNDEIEVFRHAVSIDEHRAFFRTNLFAPSPGQDAIELWFPGDHCDVGGGHPEADSGLSKYALEWMIAEAIASGLLVDAKRVDEILGKVPGSGYVPASSHARVHGKIPWYWAPAECVPKWHWDGETRTRRLRWNMFRRRRMPSAPLVHPVAWQIPDYSPHLPPAAVAYNGSRPAATIAGAKR